MSAHSEIAQPVTSSGDAAQAEWRWLDRIAPLSAVCVLIASCLLSSSRKDMWLDEGFTLELLGDRSFSHMMRALGHAADGGMPLYYIVAYGWGRVFGLSLLSLRLLSSLFICAGVLLLWSTLRKYFSLTAVSLAMTATVTTSALVLTHNAQARYYGLYFATAALVFALHALLAQTPHPGGKLLSGAILAHVALIMSHPFGLLYSIASICALLVSDFRWGKVRAGLYAMLASSWLILVLWVVPLLNLHDVAVPRNWPPPLDFSDVVSLYSFSSPCVVMVIFVVVALTALGRPAESRELRADDPRPLMTCATAFLIPPLLIALLSVGESSFFVNRYFIPSLVGVTAIVTSLFDSRLRRVKSSVPLKIAWLVMFVVFLAWPIGSALSLNDKRFVTMDRNLPNGVPVIVTDAQAFLLADIPVSQSGSALLLPARLECGVTFGKPRHDGGRQADAEFQGGRLFGRPHSRGRTAALCLRFFSRGRQPAVRVVPDTHRPQSRLPGTDVGPGAARATSVVGEASRQRDLPVIGRFCDEPEWAAPAVDLSG